MKRCLLKHSPYLTLPGLLLDDAVVRNHFQQFGCCIEGKLGPLQFVQDLTRVRELVKASTSTQAMIGFKAFQNECGEWQFYVRYDSLPDIKTAFLEMAKASYALLGLYNALPPGIPPAIAWIIPHDNKFCLEDLREWMKILNTYRKKEGLPVICVESDSDTKNLNYLEYLALSDLPAEDDEVVSLSISQWAVFGKKSEHGYPLNINGDGKHGLKLGRAQILYVDKIIPSPCGALLLQYFDDIRTNFFSNLTKKSVDPTTAKMYKKQCHFSLSRQGA